MGGFVLRMSLVLAIGASVASSVAAAAPPPGAGPWTVKLSGRGDLLAFGMRLPYQLAVRVAADGTVRGEASVYTNAPTPVQIDVNCLAFYGPNPIFGTAPFIALSGVVVSSSDATLVGRTLVFGVSGANTDSPLVSFAFTHPDCSSVGFVQVGTSFDGRLTLREHA